MSEARDMYFASFHDAHFGTNKQEAFERLSRAAELWRKTGHHFSSGTAMSSAVQAAWGFPDRMAEAQNAALEDFRASVAGNSPESPVSLASLNRLIMELRHTLWLFDEDKRTMQGEIRQLGDELAQRLLTHFASSDKSDNYLVRGILLSTDLDDIWTVGFPEYEVSYGVQGNGNQITLPIPSAFDLFVNQEDWSGANQILDQCPAAFTSHNLQGWKAVVLANMQPSKAVEFFDEAATAFALDSCPTSEELMARGGSWSGINQQLWTKYFRARARLHEAIRNPGNIQQLLQSSLENLAGTESGWHSSKVSKFRVLVDTLAKLIVDPTSVDQEKAARQYAFERQFFSEDEFDIYALKFIAEATQAFRDFQANPSAAVTRDHLAAALSALSRVPSIGPQITEAMRPALGNSALQTLLGPVHTWMHSTLESITDERKLQAVCLRLLQAGLPLYAQVRHGPVEYGKDIVVLVEENGEIVLRFYQLKCGDLTKPKWRESKDELEEMFLVNVPSLQLPVPPDRIEGILLCSGHANVHVEPVMDAWLREQKEKHGRNIEFYHLDRIINWITNDRLVNDFKSALGEQGIQIAG